MFSLRATFADDPRDGQAVAEGEPGPEDGDVPVRAHGRQAGHARDGHGGADAQGHTGKKY